LRNCDDTMTDIKPTSATSSTPNTPQTTELSYAYISSLMTNTIAWVPPDPTLVCEVCGSSYGYVRRCCMGQGTVSTILEQHQAHTRSGTSASSTSSTPRSVCNVGVHPLCAWYAGYYVRA